MPLGYESYEEAAEQFSWSERWALFNGSADEFNITDECLDRHEDDNTAARIKYRDGTTETYDIGTVRRQTNQFANALTEVGIDHGDRVAVMLNPGLELYTSLFGNLKRGAVHVQLSPLFGLDAIRHRIEDSNAKLLVTNPQKASELPDELPVETLVTDGEFEEFVARQSDEFDSNTTAEDVSVLQYTSGTTGTPDGHEMRHKTASFVAVRLLFAYGVRPEDRFFCTSSPSWAHGLWIGTVGPLALGHAVGAYAGAFDTETVLDGLAEFDITNFTAAATALRKIVNSPYLAEKDLSLKRVSTAGEKIDEETQRQLVDKLGVDVADIYGVSEFGGIIMNYNGFNDWELKPGSIGKPFPGLEVTVLDEDDMPVPPGEIGEIAVKRDNKWFRVGDLATVDEDGYYWYKGRKDEVIISAGYRIDPHAVEDALLQHDAVVEVAVVGSLDAERGEIVKGFVKTDRMQTEELKADIQQSVKESLSKHQYPRELEFVEEFPRTADESKIKRQELIDDTAG